ncbi:phosphopantetheine-binding protein [Kitasatospora sp. NBC_00374]|uniref:acyl carrier protein n=1 Tax=Kitasatospora sp. NBC_00374 TaxID=2975964 RepID=UPI003254AC75
MSDTVADQVRRLVGEMSPLGAREAQSTDRLVEDLGYDSLAVIELSLQLESTFSLTAMGQGEAADITTVGDVEGLVEKALANTADAV